jgi:hypothetical protein
MQKNYRGSSKKTSNKIQMFVLCFAPYHINPACYRQTYRYYIQPPPIIHLLAFPFLHRRESFINISADR